MKTQLNAWHKAYMDKNKRRWLFGFTKTKIVDLAVEYIKSNNLQLKKFVDVGCGSGRNSIALAQLGFEVYAIDFVKEAIHELKKRASKENLKIYAVVYDITKKWPFKENFFDAALINVVLDSINEDGRKIVANELYRTLKDNGLIFIYEPSINDEYYSQFVDKEGNNFKFICPDDGITREIFTEETLLEPFIPHFEVKFIQERRTKGKMFNKLYRRAWFFVVLQKKD